MHVIGSSSNVIIRGDQQTDAVEHGRILNKKQRVHILGKNDPCTERRPAHIARVCQDARFLKTS